MAKTSRTQKPIRSVGPAPTTGRPLIVWLTVATGAILALLSCFQWITIGDSAGVVPWSVVSAIATLGWADGLWALLLMVLTVCLVIVTTTVLAVKTVTHRALSPKVRAVVAALIVVGYVFALIYVLQTTSASTPTALLSNCNDAGYDGDYCLALVQDTMTTSPEFFAQQTGVALWMSAILGVVFAALLVSQPRLQAPKKRR